MASASFSRDLVNGPVMNKLRLYVIALMVLLLGMTLTSALVWNQGAFTHGLPDYDQGCYCHNNNVSVFINGSGDGMFALTFGPFQPGSTFHLRASTNDFHTTGAVPNYQLWMSTAGDNAKFKIDPPGATDNSDVDLNKTAGNITAIYSVTAPAAPGVYNLILYAQGTLVSPFTIEVFGENSTTPTTSTTTTAFTLTASSIAASNYTTTSTSTVPTTSSSSSSTSFITTPAQSTSSSSYSMTSTSIDEGGIPEFPYQILATTILAFLVVGSYLLVRRHGQQKESAGSLR